MTAQQRASDPAVSVWVAASAGTGKTKVLTDRVLRLLLADTQPERVLCLTFTKAAANVMAVRLAESLGKWTHLDAAELSNELAELTGAAPDDARLGLARQLFARVLDTPGGLKIQTIHSFCQSLLGRFPLEARLAPHFQVADERTAAELLEAARGEVLARGGDGDGDGGGDAELSAALGVIAGLVDERGLGELFAELTRGRGRLARIVGPGGGMERAIAGARRRLGVAERESEQSVIAAACEEDSLEGAALHAAAAALAEGGTGERERGAVL
ncbi:MAG: UvrD-helicase domain-containing protein, partial [Alphaproteobacteria bacterium]